MNPPAPRAWLRPMAAMLRLLVVAGLLTLGGGFVLFVEALDRPEPTRLRHAEGIVALTGGAERVSEALDLLLSGRGDRLLISGVNPSTSAGDLTRTAPEARPLLTCCIELGYAAGNTIGNARETRLWVRRHHIRSLIVVTSDYHMPRALAEIGAAAPGVDLVPYPVSSGRTEGRLLWEDGGRLRLALVEYLKYLVVVARTHLDPADPYEERAAALKRPRSAA